MAVKRKGGLGKGLDALIAPSKASSQSTPQATNETNKNQVTNAAVNASKSSDNTTGKSDPQIVEKIVEKIVEVPVEKVVEKRVEVPVEKVVEKIVEVPVEKVVEVPVEKVVEKIVEVPVEKVVEVPVEKVVEKIVVKNEDIYLKIDEIEPNRSQPRQLFDEDSLQELADSITLHGVIQPIIVQKHDDFYQIIAGERRWRAARLAGLTEVPVIIKDYSPNEALEIALIENLQREDLNAIEEAIAYQKLMEEFGLTQEEAAVKVSKSRTAVTNSLRLLKLDERVKQMIIDEMISSGHGRTLLAISDKELQYTIALKIFDTKLSVRETERLVKKLNAEKPAKPQPKLDPKLEVVYHSLEDKIKSIIGSKVSINAKTNQKGKIEIEYYSEEDLERIIGLLETIN